ncbi:MAG TPA: glycine/betaine ABC transporter substrate-binding protein [Clostridia bacterium]|nr:glycine/betaine ABC transporter substrate-binding protein [Clostridia bacterium]
MNKNFLKLTVFVVMLALAFMVLAGCGGGQSSSTGGGQQAEQKTVVIASKQFAESYILGHMAAILIQEKTNHKVDISKIGMGATELLHPAMVEGQIDLYPEYTGTAWMVVLGETEVVKDRREIYEKVRDRYAEQFKVTAMEPLGFQNTFAIAMKRSLAEELGISKISDLANHPGLIMVGDSTTFTRPDVYPGLAATYGLNLKESVVDTAFFYEALKQDLGHVTTCFSTDGRLKEYDFKVLEDDKSFFPPYDAMFVVRTEVLEEYAGVKEALSVLSGLIDEETMTELNYKVEVRQEDPADVAREFLVAKGLI